MRHTLRETWSGLRRNMSMTFSVIVTMWVSLALFGASLMIIAEVDQLKGEWYDRIEISAFLCNQDSAASGVGGNCTEGQNVTDGQREAIRAVLEADPNVETIYYQTKQEAYDEFQGAYGDNPVKDTLSLEQMQESFRVKLKDPQDYQGVVAELSVLDGVQAVQDLHTMLDPFFRVINALKWGTMGIACVLLLAGALQIANSIRMSAFTRRREIAIMRLAGASTTFILLPFLLEALFAGVIGSVLACGAMAGLQSLVVDRLSSQLTTASFGWIGWVQTGRAMLVVLVLGVVLSIVPTLVVTRKYLRV
ncbi:permease-like cell division protein FtsX [uncultured Propionibacterium sp.]|uniref:permease-like cell division protein FtsX n=1 Tax=uncultured Propionibacterium sp. TaxID=218066 RepID=UPI00292D9B91|nr:permease-like cell division protein FtsX [uncultured Propionibacterium sp.]